VITVRSPAFKGWLAVAILLHAVTSVGFLRALPLFNWPDEPAHFNYVRDLARGAGFPVMEPEAWAPEALERLKARHFRGLEGPAGRAELAGIRYQSHQPPLYYLAAAGVYRLWPSPTGLKLFNLALSCLALAVGGLLARRLAPSEPWVWAGALVLLALLPMRCFMAVSIGNDVAAELVFALFALAVVSGRAPAQIGLIAGAGLLVKASLVLALPLYGLWLAGRRLGSGAADAGSSAWRELWRPWLLACAVAAAVAAPWLVRNALLYGWSDPLALSAGALGWRALEAAGAVVERPGLALTGAFGLLSFVTILFRSWWGVFGWMEIFPEPRVLAVYLLLSGLVLAGWARIALRRGVALSGLWLAACPALFAAALAVYSLTDFQPQGRYLLTIAAASGVLFGRGLAGCLGRFAPWGVAGAALLLLAVDLHTVRSVIPWYLGGGG
jgi:hypothetical protein